MVNILVLVKNNKGDGHNYFLDHPSVSKQYNTDPAKIPEQKLRVVRIGALARGRRYPRVTRPHQRVALPHSQRVTAPDSECLTLPDAQRIDQMVHALREVAGVPCVVVGYGHGPWGRAARAACSSGRCALAFGTSPADVFGF